MQGMMKTALMVAEKPSLAQAITEVLSNKNFRSRKSGACTVYEWQGLFFNMNVQFKMTSVFGHVMTIDFDENFQNWQLTDPEMLFSCPIHKKQTNPKIRLPQVLEREASNCDFLILWLDCDKEGENICYEVMNSVRKAIRGDVNHPSVTYRARFSSLNHTDIIYAFQNLKYPDFNESRSVDARLEFDLRIGCAFTRFQTKFFQSEFPELRDSLVSYGPCQIPTLGFCVQRHDEIVEFVPQPYWYIKLSILDKHNVEVYLSWKRVKMFEKDAIDTIFATVRNERTVRVMNVECRPETTVRPLPLNTVELLRLASTRLGMSPHDTMRNAESLYTRGFISYPRTETTNYSNNFNFDSILQSLRMDSEYGSIVDQMLARGYNRPRHGKDVGDHAPISICKAASRSYLPNDQWRLYELVLKHFLATLSPDCRYNKTVVDFVCANEHFTVNGAEIVDPGFTTIWGGGHGNQQVLAGNYQINEIYRVSRCELKEDFTSPPDYLSETDLISLMEKHGIGTDASIPVHIQNISTRNYVQVQKNRRLVPTELGIKLIHGYNRIDPELVLPTMRSFVEQKFQMIATGQADFQSVLHTILDWYKGKYQYYVRNIIEMKKVFFIRPTMPSAKNYGNQQLAAAAGYINGATGVTIATGYSSSGFIGGRSSGPGAIQEQRSLVTSTNEKNVIAAAQEKRLSRCGKCKRFMTLGQSSDNNVVLTCSNCPNVKLSMPLFGTFRVFRELRCPVDDFELVSWHETNGKASFVLCPHCYNHKPFDDMENMPRCTDCTHPTCPQSKTVNALGKCIYCTNDGDLVVNVVAPQLRPEIMCNKCRFAVQSKQTFKKFSLSKSKCGSCNILMVAIEQNDSSGTVISGCLFCFTEIQKLFNFSQPRPQSTRPSSNKAAMAARKRKKPAFLSNKKKTFF